MFVQQFQHVRWMMQNVKTLPQSEVTTNELMGYMKRVFISGTFVVLIGDKIVSWSTNTIDSAYTKTH